MDARDFGRARALNPDIRRPCGRGQLAYALLFIKIVPREEFYGQAVAGVQFAEGKVRPVFDSMEIHVDFGEQAVLVLHIMLHPWTLAHAVMRPARKFQHACMSAPHAAGGMHGAILGIESLDHCEIVSCQKEAI
ncbi:MAG: hypothetical protein WA957_12300 [Alteraurantiacibacter sp.]